MPGGVTRGGVVGDEVAGLESHLLEEQRVRGLRLRRPALGRRERDALLGAAIHAVAQLKRRDAVVIAGGGLDGDLLERGDLGVAPGRRDAHVGPAILEHLDRVLHAAGDTASVGGDEVHSIEAARREREAAAQLSTGVGHQRHGAPIVERERATAHRTGDRGLDDRHGTSDRRDVAAILDPLTRAAGVGRVAQLDRELLHCGKVGDPHLIRRRANAVRLYVVLGGLGEIEQSACECALLGVTTHRQAHPLGRAVGTKDELRAVSGEVRERRVDVKRATARDVGIAGRHAHHRRRGRRCDRHRPGREEDPRTVAQRGGAECQQQSCDGKRAHEHPLCAMLAGALDPAVGRDRREVTSGECDHARRERRRGLLIGWLTQLVNGGDERLAQTWGTLLHVKRELSVAGAPDQREHEPPHHRPEHDRVAGNAGDEHARSVATGHGGDELPDEHRCDEGDHDDDRRLEEEAALSLPAQGREEAPQLSRCGHALLRSSETMVARRACPRQPLDAITDSAMSSSAAKKISQRHTR